MNTHRMIDTVGWCFVALILLAQQAGATASPGSDTLLQGYAKTIAGATMGYPSPLPGADTALICRATDGTSSIAWQTEPVRIPRGAQTVSFLWLAGLGCNLGEQRFALSVNGINTLTFTSANQERWEVVGRDGARLAFQSVMVDRHHDRFGFMQLTFPAAKVVAGSPLELRVTGEAAGSSAWVMTFAAGLGNGVAVTTPAVILREGGKPVQPLDLHIINIGTPETAVIRMPGTKPDTINVPFGVAHHTLKTTPATVEKRLDVQVSMGGIDRSVPVVIKPVRPWKLYLVQHTHTDIGYTRSQTEILAEHLRYIDFALDLCDQTDTYPDDAKFRWTCETAWAVREYLTSRPAEQIARLKRRVQEGRIEVTGMLLNWAEVADENALVHSLETITRCREHGLPVRTAMQDDVNGYAWCLVDYFQDLGIKYVTSGINDARALKPFTKPTPFWWESPSGKRVLAFRSDHYMTGNFYGLHTGDFDLVARELPRYLDQLESAGYAFNAVNVQYSGYSTDNSPPSTFACDIIRRWNETYEWPKLRSATVHEFLQWVEENHGSTLQPFRAAWPDWWTDGYGCALRETAAGRATQADLIVNQGLLSMAHLSGAHLPQSLLQQMQSVADNLHFYNEHTFGAAESISDPLAENSQVQWAEKSSYVWQALMQSRLLREAAMGQLQPFLTPAAEPSIVVFNTLNWPRSGLHTVYIDNQILPSTLASHIVDDSGRAVAAQLVQTRPEGNYWALWLEDVPALGYRTYRIVTGKEPRPADPPLSPADSTIETAFYRLTLDREHGAIRSLYDRDLRKELLDSNRSWQLAQWIYERLADRRPMEEHRLGEHTRTTLRNVQIKPGVDGAIWRSIVLTGASDGCSGDEGVRCEIRLFKAVKRIDVVFKARKRGVSEPEAVYVAFPFALPGGNLLFEAQGGVVSPGENQLPGTATDWNTVQNFAAVRSPQAQIVLVSDEVPLMQFGGINTGRYKYNAKPATQHIYSWVLNNYWTTNFRASQEGDMTWSYVLTSGRDTSMVFAARFGWGTRVPLVSRVLPAAGRPAAVRAAWSAWPFKPTSLLLISATPTQEGVILHLREVEGKETTLELADAAAGWRLDQADALGARLRQLQSVRLRAYETTFVRLSR